MKMTKFYPVAESLTSFYFDFTEDCVVFGIFDGDHVGSGVAATEFIVRTTEARRSRSFTIAGDFSIEFECD